MVGGYATDWRMSSSSWNGLQHHPMKGICVFVLCLSSCVCLENASDSGVDAAVDAGSVSDGGLIEATGGCFNDSGGRKFILYFENDAICAALSFRHRDAGFVPLFVDSTSGPEDYEIDEAKVGLCSAPFEETSGRLNSAGAPIQDVSGEFGWAVYQAGRPMLSLRSALLFSSRSSIGTKRHPKALGSSIDAQAPEEPRSVRA